MSVPTLDRRSLLQWASASFLAERLPATTCSNATHADSVKTLQTYTPKFFSRDELQMLDKVMEAIIPADEHSPGAHQAQVPLFADLMLASSPDEVKEDWHSGLRLIHVEIERSSLKAWLERVSAHEHDPQSPADVFFAQLKQMTVEGYYTSSIGIHQDLQYQGNTYVKEFVGCTHAEHQTQSSHLRDGLIDHATGVGAE